MYKKILSLILSFSIVFSIMPTTLIAATVLEDEAAISATINGTTTYYDNLPEAIVDADSASTKVSIKLLKDISSESLGSISKNTSGIALDMNGYTISCSGSNLMSVEIPFTLTNTSSTESKIIRESSSQEAIILINKDYKISIDNVDIISINDNDKTIDISDDSRAKISISNNMIKGKLILGSSDITVKDSIIGCVYCESDCDCMLSGDTETNDIDLKGQGTITISDTTTVYGNVNNNGAGTISLCENATINGDVNNCSTGTLDIDSNNINVFGKTCVYSGTLTSKSDKVDYICDNNGPIKLIEKDDYECSADIVLNNPGNVISSGTYIGNFDVINSDCLSIEAGTFNFDPTLYVKDESKTINVNIPSAGLYTVKDLAKVEYASLMISDDLTLKLLLDNNTVDISGQQREVSVKAVLGEKNLDVTKDGLEYHVEGINVSQVGSEIKINLYVDETQIGDTLIYSVIEYCDNLFHSQNNETLNVLLANTIAYGKLMQNYAEGYDKQVQGERFSMPSYLEPLVTTEKAVYSDNIKKTTYSAVNPSLNKVNSATLNISDKVEIIVRVTAGEGNTVIVTKNGETIFNEVTSTNWKYEGLWLGKLSPIDYDSIYEIIIKDNNGNILHGVSYSVNSYVYSKQNDTLVGDVVIALFNYGKAAVEYKKGI